MGLNEPALVAQARRNGLICQVNVAAMLAYGFGQFLGTTAVPQLIRRYSARFALVLGASGVTVFAATLAATRTTGAGAVVTMVMLGLSTSMAIVPQQHRLFALVPETAPVAMGLNGSAIYIASALGAALGGGILTMAEASALPPAAVVVGLLAITIASTVRPERSAQRRIIQQPSSDNDV